MNDELLELIISDEDFEAASEYNRRSISSRRVHSLREVLDDYEFFSQGQYVPVIPRSSYSDVFYFKKVFSNGSFLPVVTDYSAIHRVNSENSYMKSKPPKLLLFEGLNLKINRLVVANSFSTVVGEISDLSGSVDFIFTHRDLCEISSSLSKYFGANNFKGDIFSGKYDVVAQALPLSYVTESEKILKDSPLLRVYDLESSDDDFEFNDLLKKPLVDLA